MNDRKLHLSESDRKLGGVCGGLAAVLGLDANVVRILAVVLAFFTGLAPVLVTYVAAWLLLPYESDLPIHVTARGGRGDL